MQATSWCFPSIRDLHESGPGIPNTESSKCIDMVGTDPLVTCDWQNLSPWGRFYKKCVPRPLIQTATGEIIATSPTKS